MSKSKRKQRKPGSAVREATPAGTEARQAGKQPAERPSWEQMRWPTVAGAAVLLAVFLYSYWPTLGELVHAWNTQPDYSHGFFVIPLALFFVWHRWDSFPGFDGRIFWTGLLLIALSIGIRYVGAAYYLGSVDGWSIPIWLAGAVCLLFGWRVLWWAAPAIGFLWFMVPLPHSVERAFRLPLQRIATEVSTFVFQLLGLPALAEGTTIYLDETVLGVEEACSGLRIFVTIAAMAFAFVVLVQRPWWLKTMLLLSTLPIALVANSARIVLTGLLYQFASGEAAQRFSHDFAGYAMIVMAAGLFMFVLWYLSSIVYTVQVSDIGSVMRHRQARA